MAAASSSAAASASAAAAAAADESPFTYVVSAQRPTAVTHSVKGFFTSDTVPDLIVAKCMRIELYSLSADGLVPFLDFQVYGRIVHLELYRPAGEARDLLFLLTEQSDVAVLAFDPRKQAIITVARGSVGDEAGLMPDVGQLAFVDPLLRMIGLHLHESMLKVVPMAGRQLREAFNIRLDEPNLIDLVPLQVSGSTVNEPCFALLHRDAQDACHLKSYYVSFAQKELHTGPLALTHVEPSSSMLVSVPLPIGGVLVFAEASVKYWSGTGSAPVERAFEHPTVIKAVGQVDEDGSRWLVGDFRGDLYVLALKHLGGRVVDMLMEFLGETSTAASITYLDNSVVFVGSGTGDSQVVKLHQDKVPAAEGSGAEPSHIEVLDQLINLGPICDACIVQSDAQGPVQLVVTSGMGKDGSLRVIRSGIGVSELAQLDMPGITGAWPLRRTAEAASDSLLVLSFVNATQVIEIGDDRLSAVHIEGFAEASSTVLCRNWRRDCVLQVTRDSVRMISLDGAGRLLGEYRPALDGGAGIQLAEMAGDQLVLSLGGGRLDLLRIAAGGLEPVAHTTLDSEVACMSMLARGSSAPAGAQASDAPDALSPAAAPAALLALGLWNNEVVVLSLPEFHALANDKLAGEAIPRSVLFCVLEDTHYLFCAQGDGHFYSMKFDVASRAIAERKRLTLSTKPITLFPFVHSGKEHVFACSDLPTVVHSANRRLVYSNVNMGEVSAVCSWNSAAYPQSLVLVDRLTGVTFGSIDGIQKLHIKSTYLHEFPRRIAYQRETHSFGLLSIRVELGHDAEEDEKHAFKLLDEQTLEERHALQLHDNEECCSVISCHFEGTTGPYYVVGTGKVEPDQEESAEGRILLLQYTGEQLALATEVVVEGAAYSLCEFNGMLLATVNAKVVLFALASDADGVRVLNRVAVHYGHVYATSIDAVGNYIAIGDLLKSVSLLRYHPEKMTMEEIARDFNPLWVTSMRMLSDEQILCSENSYNMVLFRHNRDASSDEDRIRLEVVGEFHVGDLINRIVKGSLVMQLPELQGPVKPRALFFTVHGAIGLLATIPRADYPFLASIEDAMRSVVEGIGGMNHKKFRAFHNERRQAESSNFVDGDLVESFLDLRPDQMEKVAIQAGSSVDELTRVIQELNRMH